VVARRAVFVGVLALQALLLVRGASSDHKEFAWRPFPESSTWRADIVRVTADGTRVPVPDREWGALVRTRRLARASVWHHADTGVASQLAFLDAALEWYADRLGPGTRHVEATVTYWRNDDEPRTVVLRSDR
jgi:hypothetical protein